MQVRDELVRTYRQLYEEAGVAQLAAMERQAVPQRSWSGRDEPDGAIAEAERRARVGYVLNAAKPLLKGCRFWLSRHPHTT
jgi:hypothetical protein